MDAARPTWQGLASNNGCTLNLNATGSSNGLGRLRVVTNGLRFAATSRPLNAGAEQTELYAWKIGEDAMVFQVASSPAMAFITNITAAQVQGIFKGTIQNWNDAGLGGPATPIFADCRIVGSGSRDVVVRLFALGSASATPPVDAGCDSRLTTSADEAAAANTDFHIVYTSLANVGLPGTKELRLSGGAPLVTGIGNASTFVTPSVATVSNGTYPAPRELFLAVNKFSFLPANTNTDVTAQVKAYDFINYMLSSAGQGFVSSTGFVPVSPKVPFPAADINLDGTVALGDLGKVTGRWGQTDTTFGWVRADATKDGTIALGDIGAVTGKWGTSGAGNAFVAPN
jgi:ABC-type phosphate transport system substrate-binding protein